MVVLFEGMIVTSIAVASSAQTDKSTTFERVEVPFFDDAPKDQSLLVFRNKLQKSIEAHDVKALLDVLDPAIRNGFDAQEGIEDFKTRWKLTNKPEDSPVWRELGEVLRLGGKVNKTKDETFFIAPYSYYALPEKFDPIEFGLVVGDGVRVRAKADETSDIVAKVGRIIVRLYPEEKPIESKVGNEIFPWRKVGLPDGTIGYIWGKYVRSPNDYRAGFSNASGRWKMIYFLAGD